VSDVSYILPQVLKPDDIKDKVYERCPTQRKKKEILKKLKNSDDLKFYILLKKNKKNINTKTF